MSTTCIVPNAEVKEIMSWFKDDRTTNLHKQPILLTAIKAWRKYNQLGEDAYPDSKEELVEFWKRHGLKSNDSETEYDISYEQWEDLYDVNSGNISYLKPKVLENRLRMIASMFSEKVDKFQESHSSYSRSKCISELGGVKKIINSIIDELSALTDESLVEKFSARFGGKQLADLNENELKQVKYMRNCINALVEHKNSISILSRKFINEYETDVQVDVYSADDNPDLDGENGTELKGKRYSDHRNVDIGDTLTARAKNILSKLYRTDTAGNTLLDDFGFPVKISPREALQTLVQFCYKSTPESFMQDLKNLAYTFPWVNSLIKEIEGNKNKTGAMFGASKKAKMLYTYIAFDNGKYQQHALNTMAAHDAILRQMTRNFGSNVLDPEMSLYTETNGWTVEGDEEERKAAAEEKFDKLIGDPNHKWTLDTLEEDSEKLAKAAQGFGLDITGADIRKAAAIPLSPRDKSFFFHEFSSRYGAIANCITGIYCDIAGYPNMEMALIANNNKIHDLMLTINLSKKDDVDSKGIDNGKTRQTYITPNLISELMNDLSNANGEDSETYLQKLQDKYLKYEGFTLDGEPTGLLEYLVEHPKAAKNFHLGEVSSFSTRTYDKMKRQQVGSMQYTLWKGSKYNTPKFIIPVSADYTVCYTLQVPRNSLPSNEGESLLMKDENGNTIGYNTEASIVEKLAQETLIEYNRIRAIRERQKYDKQHPGERAQLLTYEREGQRFHIFPELNSTDIVERLIAEKDSVKQLDILKDKVAELLYQNYLRDRAYYEEQGIFTSPEFKGKVETDKSGKILEVLDEDFEVDFENFSLQTFYIRQQITKLVFGDTSHFKDILDFEKRAMMQHSPATPIFYNEDEATENVMYIKDIKSKSLYAQNGEVNGVSTRSPLRRMFEGLVHKKLIPNSQVSDYLSAYDKINSTDGQGFRTLPSWKKIQEGLGKWTDEREAAFNKIMFTDEPILKSDIEALGLGVMKLRYAGYQTIAPINTGSSAVEQLPVKSPVFHKYSEQVLLPFHRMKGLVSEMENTPIVALSNFAYGLLEQSKADPIIKVPDLFLFESGCKVGGHDICDPWHDDEGNELTTATQIREKLVSYVSQNGGQSYEDNNAIQTLDMRYLGEAANLDTKTEDTEIHITSQAEKIAWGNISSNDTVSVSGVESPMRATDARRLYDEVSAALVADAWRELCDELGSSKKARRLLLKEMGKMSYVSEETKLALTRVKDLSVGEMPLFSPTVQHEAQSIILSIIRSRMQKHKAPGARFVQKTSMGWDKSAIEYEDFDLEKLEVHFEGEGDDTHISSVDAYIPITDSRLRAYANKNGEITPEMLWGKGGLVELGIIPEEMLYAVGYRTPSDAEHSIIPIRIKGFLSPASGKTIILPREVMVMTGHDYDGDEMPVHFMHARTVLDEEKVRKEFDTSELNEEGLKFSADTAHLYRFEVEQYDYSEQPLEQSSKANEREHILDNERLRLLFAQVSSPAYTQRMIIPGGCEETKRSIKTIQLLRIAQNHPNENERTALKRRIADKLGIKYTDDIGSLFMHIRGYANNKALSAKDIEDLINEYAPAESPFSARHTVESFGYMIEAANMIGIFAKYMSSFQMLQKANVTYNPYISGEKERRTVLFGKEFNNQRMFEITDMTGENMLSRIMSRLINAAVDNGKDPLLGILNINPEVAPLMVTMCGLGMTEDQIDLVISQPSIVEALKRTASERLSFPEAISAVLEDMENIVKQTNNNKTQSSFNISYDRAADDLKNTKEDYYANEAVRSFDDITAGPLPDFEAMEFQKKILMQVRQINDAAEDLESFINSLLRPESGSGGTASTIGNTQRIIIQGDECRNKIASGDFRIGGLEDIAKNIDFRYLMPGQQLMSQVESSETPQYTLMRNLEVRGTMMLTRRWFPQARQSWQDVAATIASLYERKRIPDYAIDAIYREMVLFKMLSHEAYVGQGTNQQKGEALQRLKDHFLDEVPTQLQDLQNRIRENSKNRKEREEAERELAEAAAMNRTLSPKRRELLEQKVRNIKVDEALTSLEDNSFLNNLKVYHYKNSKLKPRIQFRAGGIDMSKLSDQVRRDWTSLLNDYYEESGVKGLAADLVEYSLFVNGFGFSTYEFGHLASIQAMRTANGGRMLNAMQGIADSDFTEEEEISNFTRQYIMNHWNDKNFLPKLNSSKLSGRLADYFGLKNKFAADDKTIITEDKLERGKFYLVKIESGTHLVMYTGSSISPFDEYSLLGEAHTVQYNPLVDAEELKPYTTSEDSAFSKEPEDPYAQSNYENTPYSQEVPDSVQDDMIRQELQREEIESYKSSLGLRTNTAKEVAQTRVQADMKNVEAAEKEKVPVAGTSIPSSNVSESQAYLDSLADSQPVQDEDSDYMSDDAIRNLVNNSDSEDYSGGSFSSLFSVTHIETNSNGERVAKTTKVPATPEGIELARKRNAYVELNRILRDILERAGVGVGKLSAAEILAYAEERLAINGVTDFETAKTLANGLIEMIRIREGEAGEQVLPEEFAHLAIQMLGGESNPIVQRLFNALRSSEEALQEAFGGEFETYQELYSNEGGDWQSRLVEEAAGKLLAKNLLKRQEIKTSKVRNLIQRIVDAFHELLRKIGIKQLHDAIVTADNEASYLAKNLLNGKLLDELNLNNISSTSKFRSVKEDLSKASGTYERLIKIESKELDILKRKSGYDSDKLNESVAYKNSSTALNALTFELRHHKTEGGITGYMDSCLDFLQRMESVIDTSIRRGEPINIICKHLDEFRESLYKTTSSLDAIRDGLASGEITDSGNVKQNVDNLAGIVQDCFDKYKRLSKEYLKKGLLEPIYGPNGLDITIGKDRGKHISIDDMASTGEEYTGIQIDAMIHSLADQRDPVLKAFDGMVRNAKYTARRIQSEYAERLVVAINKLKDATGSLDQTFMFAKDERGHKTGKFISEEKAASLSQAQYEFYREIIDIKREVDEFLPKHRVRRAKNDSDGEGIICVRKGMVQKIKDANGLKDKLLAAKDHIQNSWTNYEEEEYDTERVYVDFEGNKVDSLPIKFISKGKKESYDDMTDDVASALMAYVGMATEYNEMGKVINILENAKFATMERDIIPKNGKRTPTERISGDNFEFSETFTKKQRETTIQKILADFISMHVYGHLHKTSYITLFGKQVPIGKITDLINSITSYSQMAINIPQRISNVTTGGAQVLIQTAGKDYFSAKDVAWASGIYVKESVDRIAETGADESHNYLTLFNHRFDIGQRYNDASMKKKYGKSRFAKAVGPHLLYSGLEAGEDYLATTTGLAVARNTKLLLGGKEINLYDAYEVAYRDAENETGAYLKLKDGVTKLDGTSFTQNDELAFSKKCARINFSLQGIYNSDDRSAIQQYPLGSLIIMYRKWIAPSLKRRYGRAQYSELTGSEEQGYWVTTAQLAGRILKNWVKDGEALKNSVDVNWNLMTDYERANVKKASVEAAILVGVGLCLQLLDGLTPGDDKDDDKVSWMWNTMFYQLLRLRNEIGSQAPTPMLVQEASKIISSPMACIKLLTNALNGLKLLWIGNYFGEDSIISDENRIKSGRFKGHTQAYKYFWSLPILSTKKSIQNLIDPDALINYYKD